MEKKHGNLMRSLMVSKFAATLIWRAYIYCLNDLHRAVGGEQKYRPEIPAWIISKTRELIDNFSPRVEFILGTNQSVDFFRAGSDTRSLARAPVNTIRGGAEQGTYVCKELVLAWRNVDQPVFPSRCDPARSIGLPRATNTFWYGCRWVRRRG